MPESLTPFVEQLLAKAGMTQLPADFKQSYIAKLVSQIEQRIGLRALQELDEEQLAEFERLAQTAEGTTILDYFQLHIHDFRAKMAKVMIDFEQEFLDHSASVRKELQSSSQPGA